MTFHHSSPFLSLGFLPLPSLPVAVEREFDLKRALVLMQFVMGSESQLCTCKDVQLFPPQDVVFQTKIFFMLCFMLMLIIPGEAARANINIQKYGHTCRNTVQGRYLLSDDNGHVCDALSVDLQSRCCPETGKKFSCHGCNLVSQCCNSYEFCVSCCLNPAQTQKELAVKVKIAKPITADTYSSIFDFCAGRCRHSSESVVHENAYISEFHHCFSLPSNSSGVTEIFSELRLAGISVMVGGQGESCDSVCKSKGQSCVPGKLLVLNKCELMKKYMNCKGECIASVGADQPAEVVEDAPLHLHPGACLYTRTQAVPSCEGSHRHTRRLCPCA